MIQIRHLVALISWVFAAGTLAADFDLSTAKPPPSVAIGSTPKPEDTEIVLSVNTIPAEAKFISSSQMAFTGVTLEGNAVSRVGEDLSSSFPQLLEMARSEGANLVVFLSGKSGVFVPVEPLDTPLVLKRRNPVVTVLLFDWDASREITDAERQIRFTNERPPEDTDGIYYKITQRENTAGASCAYWTYANISRFVNTAVEHSFDTVAIHSTDDFEYENVWLPGCDKPVRIST